jgi:hypothetical protein
MKEIASALVKAQRQFGPALKTSTNPHFRSKYADLSACIEAVIDALNDNGIFLLQKNYDCSNGIMCETVFVHESGEMLECGIVHFPAVKQDPQGYASALTYARRYSLMAACGIAPEDDDGNMGSRKQFVAPNPLDNVKPGAIVQIESPKVMQSISNNKPVFTLAIPGKEPRIYETSDTYMKGTIELRDKVEKSALATRTKMTKLRELREANDAQIDKIDVQHKANLVADYNLRLKRLGATLNEEPTSEGAHDGKQ